MPTQCQRIQWLRGRAIFENIKLQFLLLFSLAFCFNNLLCVRVVVYYVDTCPRSQWLRWHSGRVVIDTVSAKQLTTLTTSSRSPCLHSQWLLRHVFRKCLRKNEKFREIVFACLHVAQVELFNKKKNRKSRDTVPLKYNILSSPVRKQTKHNTYHKTLCMLNNWNVMIVKFWKTFLLKEAFP